MQQFFGLVDALLGQDRCVRTRAVRARWLQHVTHCVRVCARVRTAF